VEYTESLKLLKLRGKTEKLVAIVEGINSFEY
jgi:hypothetical protein